MQLYRTLEQPITDRPAILTLGKFDGVHLGHQLLIRKTVERAQELQAVSVVITFDPHPSQVVDPEKPVHLLISLEERIEHIRMLGPDMLIVAPFTREVMMMSARTYMQRICSVLPLKELWVGRNFSIGHQREGDVARLTEIGKELGYVVRSIPPLTVFGEIVSATRIRQLLSDGIVEGIAALLGRPFSLSGEVIVGDQRGKTIGFPTANIQLAPDRLLPAHGVYACCASTATLVAPAAVNVGTRPTFDGKYQMVEAHLIGWSGNLYGQELHIEFWNRLRGERKFAALDGLKAQIARDCEQALELLGPSRLRPDGRCERSRTYPYRLPE